MRIRSHIGLIILAALLTACVYPYDVRPDDGPVLSLVVEFPDEMQTKASVGEQSALANENKINNLSIWVFDHDAQTHPLIAAKTISVNDAPIAENVWRYALRVSTSFAENPSKVDVFVLANAGATGCSLSTGDEAGTACSSYAAVSGAFLQDGQGDYNGFGTVSPVRSVTEAGLPMSGCLINQAVEGEDPQLSVPTVTLTRTVSRIRFVFCKAPSNTDIKISGITLHNGQTIDGTLKGGLIAANEYLFLTNGGTTNLSGYVTSDFNYFTSQNAASGTDIASNADPEALIYGHQDPDAYEQLLQEALEAGELTALPSKAQQFTYLRESDKQLTGTISYVVYQDGGWTSKSQSFLMEDPGDFARDHTWTVYAYFLPNTFDLQLQVTVLPWTGYQTSDINTSHL